MNIKNRYLYKADKIRRNLADDFGTPSTYFGGAI